MSSSAPPPESPADAGQRLTRASNVICATSIAVAIGDRDHAGVLLLGPSAAGKSDLALRLIEECSERRTRLISDDYTMIEARNGAWLASPPPSIRGLLEIRGIGVVELESVENVRLVCAFDLASTAPREGHTSHFWPLDANHHQEYAPLPLFALAPFEPSAMARAKATVRAARYGHFREFGHDRIG